ncbi:MAG: TetR/AcrR family transcriptional regulator [Ruminococcaceae bacterium]|nr:TetR/AcrR family transcriptional regulator [Oscillospiraceae bacterium]
MKQDATRQKLIDGTIHVIARYGLDKATTKSIGEETSINQAYIYRHFEDKEDMLAQTFESLDEELAGKVMQSISVMYMQEMECEMRCHVFFASVWRFILGNEDKCLTFIRYYYSPYFRQYSEKSHNERYKPLVEKIKVAFRDEANVWMILNHILNVMLDFAVKVFDGAVPDNDDTAEHVFRLIYSSVRQYFRNEEF